MTAVLTSIRVLGKGVVIFQTRVGAFNLQNGVIIKFAKQYLSFIVVLTNNRGRLPYIGIRVHFVNVSNLWLTFRF